MTTSGEYEQAALRELVKWPCAGIEFGRAGKHLVATVMFGGKSKKVFYPGSPSDSGRGSRNFCQNVRQALRDLGAHRLTPPEKPASGVPKLSDKPSRPRRSAKLIPPAQKPMFQSQPDKWLEPLKALRQAMEKAE